MMPLKGVLPIFIVALLVSSFVLPVLADTPAGSMDGPASNSGQVADWTVKALVHGRQLALFVGDWASDGFRRYPVIMIGLAGLVVMPLVAILGWLVLGHMPSGDAPSGGRDVVALPRSAWMQIEGNEQRRLSIEREIVQIGRDTDNDICLGDSSVHRYHAVIERLPDMGYCIFDLSGPNGHGVRVNGRRMAKAWLASGDVVQIGRSRLRFETAA
jgi:hypothetical protein